MQLDAVNTMDAVAYSANHGGNRNPPTENQTATIQDGKIIPLRTVIVTQNYYQTEQMPNTLQFIVDDIIYVLTAPDSDWWDGIIIDPVGNITRGWFPKACTKPYSIQKSASNTTTATVTTDSNKTIEVQGNDNSASHKHQSEATVPPNSKNTLLFDDYSGSGIEDTNNANIDSTGSIEAKLLNKGTDDLNSSFSSGNRLTPEPNSLFKSNTENLGVFKSNSQQTMKHSSSTPINESHSRFVSQTPHSPLSQSSNPRRQSLRPRHHSYSHYHVNPHYNSKHSVSHHYPMNNTYFNEATLNSMTQNSQSSATLRNDSFENNAYNLHGSPHQNSVTSYNTSSPGGTSSIFKDKHYFTSKHSSMVSFNSQHPVDSRQSSQAFTDLSGSSFQNSVHLVSNDEINSYFTPDNPQFQPSFNFIPTWTPQFTQDLDIVYKNQTLNVATTSLPFIDADYVTNTSNMEIPDSTNLSHDLHLLPLKLHSHSIDSTNSKAASHSSSNINSNKEEMMNFSQSVGSGNDSTINKRMGNTDRFQLSSNIACLANLRPTEIFYTNPSDILTWDTLSESFLRALDACVKEYQDKPKFKQAMNNASDLFSLYHVAARLMKDELIESDKFPKFSAILKQLTHFFINFRLLISFVNALAMKSDLSTDSKIQLNENVTESIRYRQKLEKTTKHLCDFIELIPIPGPNGLLRKNESKILPMVYSRLVRDKFEGGNFINPFVNFESIQNDFFIDSSRANANLLLDDDVLQKLKHNQHQINEFLNEITEILNEKFCENTTLQTFTYNRNLKLLTLIYQFIPLLSKFLDTVESIDLTVFAMIDKLADKQNDRSCKHNQRHETLVSNSDSATKFGRDGSTAVESLAESGYNESEADSSQSFYDATSKIFRPLVQEFIHLKQSVHSIFTEIILDSQTITADDPETFFVCDDAADALKNDITTSSKIKKVTEHILERLQKLDSIIFKNEELSFDSSSKFFETIRICRDRVQLLYSSIEQLKEERRSILNYCSRLMNTDFNIASLFIAERHNTMVSKSSRSTSEFLHPNDKSVDSNNVGVDIYYSGRFNDNNGLSDQSEIPWFLGMDSDEECLVYEQTSLKGGPIKGLISKLVNPLNPYDEFYEQSFLSFFSTFIKPAKFFEYLIEKYRISMPEALNYEEYGIWLEQKFKPQQKNVLNVFKTLFSQYWIVNYTTSELIEVWETFVDETPTIDSSLVELSFKVFSFKNQEDYITYFKLGNSEPKTVPMSLPNARINDMRLENLNLNYAAEQITAVQAFYYRKLNLWDLLGRTYNFNRILRIKHDNGSSANNRDPLGTKNIANFIKNCNSLTHFTIYMILRKKNLNERVEIIKYFIKLAEKLLLLKNFSSMTAIISGLGSTSVSRLRKTWEGLSQTYILKFQKMDNLMSIGKNYSEYRNMLKFMETDTDPYLPFLGMYLSDLRFTTDGNSDWLSKQSPNSEPLVNFSKRINIMKIVDEVLRFNDTLYNIKLDLDFSRYIHEMFTRLPDDEKLYEMSIEIEPRVSLLRTVPT